LETTVARETLTIEEVANLRSVVHYALGTQFGEVANRSREGAVTNVLHMYIEDLLTERIQGVPDHVKRKQQ
jgi:hypothetical protein